ncbi:efflux RND transporter periplasmic adaptor subunit [Ensifer adhaerens]|nr:efflux RND transporter periplasmic adaptor subunit [Ensifer adhaerens]MBZ7925057.1 efflux RND transporter periplasmic adaptor subunit [Ensifer adhaerens]UAX97768.1 efflux RND transporter periplasmic adaptor subunit [Ensifer adhaerens]UAY05074.1 efflux RND transporter periplasmic adaptor subunit [Ensifer adhaerens]UAY12494.1 efflux RND transporter periplasmic adaptor subunit [Ensifer adhaerens]
MPIEFRRRISFIATIALISTLSAALAACSEEKSETAEVVRPVKVVEIAQADNVRQLSYSGAVRARTEMNLGFRVSGKIVERIVNVGDRVKVGDLLARIDPTDYELAVRSASANLDAAERQVETVELVRDRAKQLLARKFASQAQFDQAVLSYNQAVATRDAAKSALSQAKNQVVYTSLVADRPGIVTAINADVGQVVGSGTPVATVAVEGEKEVQVAVPETEISNFKAGLPIKVGIWSDAGLSLDGRVREVAGSADQQSRTFSVRVSLPNDPRVLLGMTATIEASAGNGASFVSVPLSALAEKDGYPIVWVVDRGTETVRSRPVTLTDFTPDGVRVTEGLKVGDLVVAAGTQFMTDDLKVTISTDTTHQAAAAAEAVVR